MKKYLYINIRGKEVLILNITKYDGECKLWMVHKNTTQIEENNVSGFCTNREDLISIIKSNTHHMNFRKIKLNNTEINFESSHFITAEYSHGNDLILINYFIEKGYLDEKCDEVRVEDIIFSRYIQNKDENLSIINKNIDTKVLLELEEEYIEHLIQHPLKVNIGKYEKDNKIHYKDYDGKDNYFYLDEIVKYDLWKETKKSIDENIENVEL